MIWKKAKVDLRYHTRYLMAVVASRSTRRPSLVCPMMRRRRTSSAGNVVKRSLRIRLENSGTQDGDSCMRLYKSAEAHVDCIPFLPITASPFQAAHSASSRQSSIFSILVEIWLKLSNYPCTAAHPNSLSSKTTLKLSKSARPQAFEARSRRSGIFSSRKSP